MKSRSFISHIKDFGLNTLAFGLYIAIQQLFIMPVLSKITDDIAFAEIILFISIFNIVCIVFGDELGNVNLMRSNVYMKKGIYGDFHVILFSLIIICVSILIIANFFIGFGKVELLIYILIIIFGITRYFSMSYYKLKQHFHYILFMNILYGFGALTGLYVAIVWGFYLAPFFIGEFFSFIFVIFMIFKDKDQRPNILITPEFNNTLVIFGQLGIISVIMNTITYLDRILIYPILGATAMAVYYSASSMSKMISLINNPISGVILAKLTQVNKDKKDKIVLVIIKFFIPSLIVSFVGSIALSYFGVKLLYPKYFEDAIELLIPIGIATSFSLISFLIKPVMMIFFKTKDLLVIHVFYAMVFFVSMYYFSNWWGILGFAWAVSLARFTCFVCYLLVIKVKKDESVNACNSDT